MLKNAGNLTLDQFRQERNWTFKELAEQLGVSTSRAWYLCREPGDHRQRTPDKDEMGLIIRLSKGRVSPNSFWPLPQRKKAA